MAARDALKLIPRRVPRWIPVALGTLTLLVLLAWGAQTAIQMLRQENRIRDQHAATEQLAAAIAEQVLDRLRGVTSQLAASEDIRAVASHGLPVDDPEALLVLDTVKRVFGASLVYVLDHTGTVVACTRYGDNATLTGKNYAFRPYFRQALSGADCIYPAVGVTTLKRGLYFSSPVRAAAATPAGVVVIKVSFDTIDALLRAQEGPTALTTPDGIVLASNRPDWLYRAALPIGPARRQALRASQQFSDAPLAPLPVKLDAEQAVLDDRRHSIVCEMVPSTSWRIITLDPVNPEYPLTRSQMRVAGYVATFVLALLGALAALIASVSRRRRAEAALRQARDTLEIRVSERTGELARAVEELKDEIAERQRIEERLRTSERRLADIINFLPDATFAIDREGRVTAWNQAIEQLSGIPAADMLGKRGHAYAVPFYGDHRPTLIDHVLEPDESIATCYPFIEQRGHTFVTEVETPALPPGDRVVWAAATRLHDPDGNVVGAIESVRDVTERRRAQRELEQAKDAAEAATRAKTEFLANMSHEIRTPMTAILGFADALSEGCPQHCEFGKTCFGEQIETIRRNGDHLLQIINDVLDLSRVEADRLEIERVRCSPRDLVHDVCTLMQVRANARDLSLESEFRPGLPPSLLTDPTRVRQILVNLVGNAIKFSEHGTIRVVAGPAPDSNQSTPRMCFEVIDNGIGMTPEQVKRLFQPFTQGDSSMSRRFGGTGLGLSISKRLADLLDGQISVESKPGQGSCFRLTLDAEAPDEWDAPQCPPETTSPPPENHPQGPVRLSGCVLLVEDGPDNQRLLSLFLKAGGLDVSVAENGQIARDRALERWRSGSPFDLILMDIQMPVMDGYDATRELRRAGYQGPIIALTAHAMAGDHAKCIQAGCDYVLTKPINRGQLLRTAERYLTTRPHEPITGRAYSQTD